MNELQLIKSDKFGLVEYDIYSDGKEMFMTSEQLGECLRFSNGRKGIDNIVARNEYLKDPEFSVTLKLRATDGKRYNTRVFKEDGIYEVTMLANTDVAKEFRARVRKVLKALRSGEITAKPSKALETEEYHYFPKTLNGEPVITLADFEHFTGINGYSARYTLYKYYKNGVDFRLLEGAELAAFKAENRLISKLISTIIIITKSGADKLINHFGCKADIPQMIESKPQPVIEVVEIPRYKTITTEDCIVALNVLMYIKSNSKKYQAEFKKSGDMGMVEHYDKDIAAVEKTIKNVGALVFAGY